MAVLAVAGVGLIKKVEKSFKGAIFGTIIKFCRIFLEFGYYFPAGVAIVIGQDEGRRFMLAGGCCEF